MSEPNERPNLLQRVKCRRCGAECGQVEVNALSNDCLECGGRGTVEVIEYPAPEPGFTFGQKVYTVRPWPTWSQLRPGGCEGLSKDARAPGVTELVYLNMVSQQGGRSLVRVADANGRPASYATDKLFTTAARAAHAARYDIGRRVDELRQILERYDDLSKKVPAETEE